MIDQIKKLERLSKLLEPTESQRAQWNAEVLDYSNTFINTLSSSKAFINSTANDHGQFNLDLDINKAKHILD